MPWGIRPWTGLLAGTAPAGTRSGAVWTSPSDIHFFLTNPPVSGVIPRAKAIAVVGSKVYLGGNFPSLP
jgi:hypothetical protein